MPAPDSLFLGHMLAAMERVVVKPQGAFQQSS
jgi:hypothetical protein